MSSTTHIMKNRSARLLPAFGITVLLLAACDQTNGTSGGEYSSSSSEGFVWASSYSSSAERFVENGCIVGGCSSEICSDEGEEPAVSPCIFQPEFACYRTARCEKQSNGSCGWTQTDELLECREDAARAVPRDSGFGQP